MKNETRRSFLSRAARLTLVSMGGTFLTGASCGRSDRVSLSNKNSNADKFEPGYLKLHKTGELKQRGEDLYALMRSCTLCPRRCGVNRLEGEKGFCNADNRLIISSHNPHFGEERPLVGSTGSGTIFMSNCNLRCVYCINWQVAIRGDGREATLDQFADMMISLQNRGCKNINIVTPTHYSSHALLALDRAAAKGLRVPLVWNTSGWELVDILKMLDGVVDIYLPDFKYSNGDTAAKYSSDARAYPEETAEAMIEMNRQVGVAVPADDGIMYRGLMIRHLVLPGNTRGSIGVMKWIGENLPKNTYINLMSQYRPSYRSNEFEDLSRRITSDEFNQVVRAARDAGLTNLDIQRGLFL